MAYDIPSISDLEAIQLLNKHYAEVITSKKDGIASGADITQTTNPITGVTRRTLYKILDDMDDTFLERLLKMAFTLSVTSVRSTHAPAPIPPDVSGVDPAGTVFASSKCH